MKSYRDTDTVGHSGIQPHSMGPLFPAVIAVVEVYEKFISRTGGKFFVESGLDVNAAQDAFYAQPLEARLRHRTFELIYPGGERMTFSSYEDAQVVAEALNNGFTHRTGNWEVAARLERYGIPDHIEV